MSFSVNKITLVGRLGKDPEVTMVGDKQTPKATFPVATDRSYKKGDDWEEVTTWHNVVLWGKMATVAGDKLKKGQRIYIEGYQDHREFDGKDGQKRYWSEVVAREAIFLDAWKKDDNSNDPVPDSGSGDGVPF